MAGGWRSTSARFRTQELVETPNLARHCSLQLVRSCMNNYYCASTL